MGRFGTITEDIVHLLERSCSWMNYSAILGYFMALVYGVLAVATISIMAPQMAATGAPGGLVFLIYFVFAIIVFMISHHLRAASRKAKQIRDSANPAMALSDVLQHQHYVWKISGIISLLFLLILIPGLFILVAAFVQGLVT